MSIAAQTSATTTCARNGRSAPLLEPTPSRLTRGSPGTDGNDERDGGPAIAVAPRSVIEQRVDVLPRLCPHQRCGQIERLGHQALNLRHDLLDDIARLLEARAGHGDREFERPGTTRGSRHQAQ